MYVRARQTENWRVQFVRKPRVVALLAGWDSSKASRRAAARTVGWLRGDPVAGLLSALRACDAQILREGNTQLDTLISDEGFDFVGYVGADLYVGQGDHRWRVSFAGGEITCQRI